MRRVIGILTIALAAAACGDDGSAIRSTTAPSTSAPTGSTTVAVPSSAVTSSPVASTASTTRSPATTVPATTAGAPRLNLRTVDWLATLRGINLFKVDTTAFDAGEKRPFVDLLPAPGVSGYALLEGIDYGDLSGDGVDEALISLFSGGTAGNVGLLVFNVGSSGRVELTGPIDFYKGFGYKTGGVIRNGALAVTHVVAGGWEPNCCQSGTVTRRFQIVNGLLAQQGATVEEGVLGARGLTIEHFYELIDRKQLDDAYANLSSSYQSANSLAAFKSSFASVSSAVATSQPTDVAGPVKFRLETVESGTKRTYTGTWSLVYSTAKHQWLLDKAEVQLGG